MKRTIQLRESDIHRMVMEAVRRLNEEGKDAEYINQDYGTFAPEAFDATGAEKDAQEDAAWNLYNDQHKIQIRPDFIYDKGSGNEHAEADMGGYSNLNVYDYFHGYPSMMAQGGDSISKTLFNQSWRGNGADSVKADDKNWWGPGIDYEYNDDGTNVLKGMDKFNNGMYATRDHNYPEIYTGLRESINRAVKRTIKRRLR